MEKVEFKFFLFKYFTIIKNNILMRDSEVYTQCKYIYVLLIHEEGMKCNKYNYTAKWKRTSKR